MHSICPLLSKLALASSVPVLTPAQSLRHQRHELSTISLMSGGNAVNSSYMQPAISETSYCIYTVTLGEINVDAAMLNWRNEKRNAAPPKLVQKAQANLMDLKCYTCSYDTFAACST